MEKFRAKIRAFVLPEYRLNDKGHQIGHADNVCNLALELNEQHVLMLRYECIVVAAYFHDMFARYREMHELFASSAFSTLTEPWFDIFNATEVSDIECAILEHRASYGGSSYYSLLSELIASADRGKPENIDKLLKRIISCDITKQRPKDMDEQTFAINFLKRKSGSGGYAKYPPLYERIYEKELLIFRQEIDNLKEK